MKKSYILVGIFIIFIVFISIVGSIVVTGNKKIKEEKDILDIQTNKEVYFSGYGYSIDNPNIIVNPYGNSPLTAIVMFETNDYSNVSISVKSKDGNSDINYEFPKDKHHLIPIYGLYADYNNTVVISSEGVDKVINIKTDKLPDDFVYVDSMESGNFRFYNGNYPYAIDSNDEVRWYLNGNYYGDILVLDNSKIVIGSDKYTEDGNTISFYEMNFLGKIYHEYLLPNGYYGVNALYNDNILILSDKLMLIDLQTGELIEEYIKNDDYNYICTIEDDIIVGKDDLYYRVTDGELEEYSYKNIINEANFYNNTGNYKLMPSNRFGSLKETPISDKRISLIKYSKSELKNIKIEKDNNRIKIINDSDNKIYIILDKFLDKRVYEVGYIKYINTFGLKGKYTVYFKVDDDVYKTDYYIEV